MLKRMAKKAKKNSRRILALVCMFFAGMVLLISATEENTQEDSNSKNQCISFKLIGQQINLVNYEDLLNNKIANRADLQQTWRYQPTEEELNFAYRLAFAEAGNEGEIGQTAVIEVALNAVDAGYADTILEEFLRSGRYSSVIDGVPQVPTLDDTFRPVTEEDLSDSLKEAVRRAFQGEKITEEALKVQAESQGLYDESYWKGGALYFFCWDGLGPKEKERRNEESMPVRVEIGNHTFARYWE